MLWDRRTLNKQVQARRQSRRFAASIRLKDIMNSPRARRVTRSVVLGLTAMKDQYGKSIIRVAGQGLADGIAFGIFEADLQNSKT